MRYFLRFIFLIVTILSCFQAEAMYKDISILQDEVCSYGDDGTEVSFADIEAYNSIIFEESVVIDGKNSFTELPVFDCGWFILKKGVTVTFKNITVLNFDTRIFLFEEDSAVIFGENVRFQLREPLVLRFDQQGALTNGELFEQSLDCSDYQARAEIPSLKNRESDLPLYDMPITALHVYNNLPQPRPADDAPMIILAEPPSAQIQALLPSSTNRKRREKTSPGRRSVDVAQFLEMILTSTSK